MLSTKTHQVKSLSDYNTIMYPYAKYQYILNNIFFELLVNSVSLTILVFNAGLLFSYSYTEINF